MSCPPSQLSPDEDLLATPNAEDLRPPREIVWIDRTTNEETVLPLPPGLYEGPALSPEGNSLALAVRQPGGPRDVIIVDLEQGRSVPLAQGPDDQFAPVWTPDGERDPAQEWTQIYDEAWRINRDYFYDPGMHGADWPALKEKYAQFLPDLATRQDLNRVMQWLHSELAVGHHAVGGGDLMIQTDNVPGGLLGADSEIENGRYWFSKVYGGLNWNPQMRSPLTAPGVEIQEGDYLLAVRGVDLRAPENLY